MPSVSKAQWRYFKGVKEGNIPPPKGMTRAKAAEWTQNSPKGLPERKPDGQERQRRRQRRGY